ncbi:MAG: biopolymer transporter ExbD [Burkholderiaceae bacterium]
MRFRRPTDDEPEVNLIPLIDVLLIVLIFLSISTTYSRYAELQITLPNADATQTAERPREVNIAITADGRYAIEKKLLPGAEMRVLAEALKSAANGRDDTVIVINADAQAPHQAVISAMEAARVAGIVRISFATQRAAGASQ